MRRSRPVRVALFVAITSSGASTARAEVETSTRTLAKPAPAYAPAPDAPLDEGVEKRARPDYDGRPERPPSAGEVMLWVPRVLFSPVYLVTEFVVRRPIGFVLTEIEKARAWEFVIDIFTFDDRRIGIVPTFFVQFDLRSSVGLYLFWNDLWFDGNQLRSNFAFGGERWWLLSVRDRIRIREDLETELGFVFLQRPDQVFAGTGAGIRVEDSSRFLEQTIEGRAAIRSYGWRQSRVEWSARIARHRFDGDSAGFDDPSLDDAIELGFFERPNGLETGYTVLSQQLLAVVDSRRRGLRTSGTGLRGEARLEAAVDLEHPGRAAWMTYGGRLAGFLDVGDNHIFGLGARIESQAPFRDRTIPFTELSRPGSGPFEMSGFTPGVLRGRSSAVATVEYRWPIWVLVDGSLHVSAGNVFDDALGSFAAEKLRLSYGVGLRSSDRDNPFTLVLAFGTRTFDQGTNLESVRFAFGTGF